MTAARIDQRSPGRRARDEQIAAEPQLAPLDLPAAASIESLRGGSPDEIRSIWSRLRELRCQDAFPLSDVAAASLRASLQKRILALYEAEKAAHAAMGVAVGNEL